MSNMSDRRFDRSLVAFVRRCELWKYPSMSQRDLSIWLLDWIGVLRGKREQFSQRVSNLQARGFDIELDDRRSKLWLHWNL